ncbi:MAG: hypothetical protein ABR550_10015, partial [Wenzhouxiangellaceae bacterium]
MIKRAINIPCKAKHGASRPAVRWHRSSALRRLVVLQVLLGTIMLGLSACQLAPNRPDLQRLYTSARENVEQPPVIIIPGLMGSELTSENGDKIWIGSVWDVVFSDYRDAALKIDPETLMPDPGDVRATGITGKFAGRNFYQPIIDVLEDVGGFQAASAGTAV